MSFRTAENKARARVKVFDTLEEDEAVHMDLFLVMTEKIWKYYKVNTVRPLEDSEAQF